MIAKTMVCEMNQLNEDIAQSRMIQVKGRYEPWANEETRRMIKDTEDQPKQQYLPEISKSDGK